MGDMLRTKDKAVKILTFFLIIIIFVSLCNSNFYFYKPFHKNVKVCGSASLLGGILRVTIYLTTTVHRQMTSNTHIYSHTQTISWSKLVTETLP